MNYSYFLLNQEQQNQIASVWRDDLNPSDYIYELNDRNQVIGRRSIAKPDKYFPALLPKPVKSSIKPAKRVSRKEIERQLAWPGPNRSRSNIAHIFISALVGFIYSHQKPN